MEGYFDDVSKFYKCKWCNRKYKTVGKFEKHVDENHPDARLCVNNVKFTDDDIEHLVRAVRDYCEMLIMIEDINDDDFRSAIDNYIKSLDHSINLENKEIHFFEFISMSHKLLPQKVESGCGIDQITRIASAHRVFMRRAIKSRLAYKADSDLRQLKKLIQDFQRFLNMGRPWKGGNYCLSLSIDLIWHASMMNHEWYSSMCKRFQGSILPHCLEENDNNYDVRYKEFLMIFKTVYNRSPILIADLIEGSDNVIYALEQQKIARKKLEEENAIEMDKVLEATRIRREKEHAEWRIKMEKERAEAEKIRQEYFDEHGEYPHVPWDREDARC
jgi:hypothetical protein